MGKKKYITIIIFVLITVVIFAGCNSNSKSSNDNNVYNEEKQDINKNEENNSIYLKMNSSNFSINDKEIPYTIVNETGEKLQVVLVPIFEVYDDNEGYKVIPCNVGFCGTPDPLDKELYGTISLDWYENVNPGKYRLSFIVKTSDKDITISEEFDLS